MVLSSKRTKGGLMFDDLLIIVKVSITVSIFIILICFLIFWPLNHIAKNDCKKMADVMNTDYSYSITYGCLIKKNGKFIPYEKNYYIEEQK